LAAIADQPAGDGWRRRSALPREVDGGPAIWETEDAQLTVGLISMAIRQAARALRASALQFGGRSNRRSPLGHQGTPTTDQAGAPAWRALLQAPELTHHRVEQRLAVVEQVDATAPVPASRRLPLRRLLAPGW